MASDQTGQQQQKGNHSDHQHGSCSGNRQGWLIPVEVGVAAQPDQLTFVLTHGDQQREDPDSDECHRHQLHADVIAGIGFAACLADGADDFVEAESKTDQSQRGSNPGQGCALSCSSVPCFGQFRVGVAHPCWKGQPLSTG